MPTPANRTRIDAIEWSQVLPVVKLASSFRIALQPGKLIIALLAVLMLHLTGVLMDTAWSVDAESPYVHADGPEGIYETFVTLQQSALHSGVRAVFDLDFGAGYGDPIRSSASDGLLTSLVRLTVQNPAAVIDAHPWFALIYGLIALAILTLLGGVLCRMAATQACKRQTCSAVRAGRFVADRWFWFIAGPLMPVLLIGFLALLLFLAGLVFFNVQILEVIGALLYGPLLLLGLAIALIGVVFFFAIHLMTPALATEGTDGFDAISRAMNYVIYKPWQMAGYVLAATVYAAVVYVIVATVAGLTLTATHGFVGAGSFASYEQLDEVSRHDAIHAQSEAAPKNAFVEESTSAWYAAKVLGFWTDFVWMIAAAVMLSLYFTLQTWVYLLMRRSADGTPLDECFTVEQADLWSSPVDEGAGEPESATDAIAAKPPDSQGG